MSSLVLRVTPFWIFRSNRALDRPDLSDPLGMLDNALDTLIGLTSFTSIDQGTYERYKLSARQSRTRPTLRRTRQSLALRPRPSGPLTRQPACGP